jgi:hypothetical protein
VYCENRDLTQYTYAFFIFQVLLLLISKIYTKDRERERNACAAEDYLKKLHNKKYTFFYRSYMVFFFPDSFNRGKRNLDFFSPQKLDFS